MKKTILTISALLLIANIGVGQLNPTTNLYILNPMSINPAYAGESGALNVSSFYGRQWVGVNGSPAILAFSADAPFADRKLGLGLMIISDKIGVTKENQLATSYAYKIELEEGILSLGLGANVMTTNTAYSDLVVIDPGDEIYLIDSKLYVVANFSFGMYYSGKNYFAGFSVPRLLNYNFDFTRNKYVIDNSIRNYSYLLNTGYIYDINERFKIFPSLLLRYSSVPSQLKLQYDINAHLCYLNKFWIGGSYRNKRTFATMFQVQPNDQLRIAYTYNIEISQLGKYSKGSHEVMLRYIFRYNVDALNPLIF
ncbi:MAG: type IX secretion system membrane protein PorP/SprF [Bacteroidales bacterium]|nr:type IX secretion system membrane protein PorP/SprF [Bacteroidales bacterium]